MSKKITKIASFITVAAVATIAIAAFATPSAQATYTETPVAPVTQVNDDLQLNDVATALEATEVEDTTAAEVESAAIETAEETTEAQAVQSADSKTQNNTTARSNNNTAAANNNNSTRKSGSKNTQTTQPKNNTNTNNNSNKNNTNNGAAFTPDEQRQAPVSSEPVRLSQTAPYYYNNVLSAAEKNIYNTMLNGMNNLSAEIALGENLTKEQIGNAFNALVRDQSELFWVGLSYTISTTTTTVGTTSKTSYTFKPAYTLNASQVSAMKAKLDSEVNSVLATLNGAMSQFDIETAVHDYIVRKVTYNNNAVKNPQGNPMSFTAYGALVEGKAVCEGYSKAFQLILNKVGIQTTLVSGKTSSGNHMWNMVNIDGSWYHVDATFDDPNNGTANAVLRTYLNLTASEMSKTHSVSNPFSVPNASQSSKNYFTANGLYFDSYNSAAANKLYNEVVRTVNAKGTVAQIRVGGSMSSALSVLTSNANSNGLSSIKAAAQKATGKSFSRFSYSTDAALGIITVYLAY